MTMPIAALPVAPLAAAAATALPWGIELSGVWRQAVWAEGQFDYWYPVRVTLTGTGPGRAPVPAGFTVALDSQVVRGVTVESATLGGRPHRIAGVGTERTATLHRSRWRSTARLGVDEVLEVYLRVSTVTPAGPLPTITHPVVTLLVGDSTVPRRLTGRDDLARHDSLSG